MNTNYVYPSAQVGEFRNAMLYASGPASYATAGDTVYNPGSSEFINFPSDCTSLSGNYQVRFVPSAVGLNQIRAGGGVNGPSQSGWTARWFFNNIGGGSGVAKVAQNAAGTGMTPGTYPITFSSWSRDWYCDCNGYNCNCRSSHEPRILHDSSDSNYWGNSGRNSSDSYRHHVHRCAGSTNGRESECGDGAVRCSRQQFVGRHRGWPHGTGG